VQVRASVLLMCGVLSAFIGCGGAMAKQRADGTYALECSNRKACLDRAERICGSDGFAIVGGRSNKKLYGVPGNEKLIGKDEIYVRCNKDRPTDAPDETNGTWRLKQRDTEANPAASTPPATPPTAAKLVCRPGETQQCVGPAACVGGQACLSDGSGYAPCDCGGPASAVGPSAAGAPAR
jgi:hypothetical protein